MIAWILSKLFPPDEPIYHVYRRVTKKIPVPTDKPGMYLRSYKFRNTLVQRAFPPSASSPKRKPGYNQADGTTLPPLDE